MPGLLLDNGAISSVKQVESAEEHHPITLGLIGLGGMGRMYLNAAQRLNNTQILICDVPAAYDSLCAEFKGHATIAVVKDPQDLAARSDFILLSVPTDVVQEVINGIAPYIRSGCAICAQTSVKSPEMAAYERYLDPSVDILSCHSMHGPNVKPKDQPMVVIRQRAREQHYVTLLRLARALESRVVELSWERHDRIAANTQVLTHTALLSMATAWRRAAVTPWDCMRYCGGIENAKANLTARMLGNNGTLYADLAFANSFAPALVELYSQSSREIEVLMRTGNKEGLQARMMHVRRVLFENTFDSDDDKDDDYMLFDDLDAQLAPFGLERAETDSLKEEAAGNSQLSLLALADTWARAGIRPREDWRTAATPLYTLMVGLVETIVGDLEVLNKTIQTAIECHRAATAADFAVPFFSSIQADDMAFVLATQRWSQCIATKDRSLYLTNFQHCGAFFSPRLEPLKVVGNRMLAGTIPRSRAGPQRDSALRPSLTA